MFIVPTWLFNKSQKQEKQYNYYEKQVVPNVTFISADVPVIFTCTVEESELYNFETGEVHYFPREYYGFRVDIPIDDESTLYKLYKYHEKNNKEFEQMAMNTERYRIATEELYNKIRQERGELPEIKIESYIDALAIKKNEHVSYSERYVGRY